MKDSVRVCTGCKEGLQLSDFGKLKKSKDGYNYRCKKCANYYKKQEVKVTETTKVCSSCKEYKEFTDFHKSKSTKSGYKSNCKSCIYVQNKEYRENNPEKIAQWVENSKEVTRIRRKEYYNLHREDIIEKVTLWRKNNPEKSRANVRKSKSKRVKYYQEQTDLWSKNKRIVDPKYKLKQNTRSLIACSFFRILKGTVKKSKKSETILGCDFNFFIAHIESQFLNWMSWDNYGNVCETLQYNCSWDLDHIIPISSAKTEYDVILLNHWSNFQPLCSKFNRDIKRDIILKVSNIELKITIN